MLIYVYFEHKGFLLSPGVLAQEKPSCKSINKRNAGHNILALRLFNIKRDVIYLHPSSSKAGGILCTKLKTLSGSYCALIFRSRAKLRP